MAGGLATELLEAGLVTEKQMEAAGAGRIGGSRLARALIDQGLDENALAGFFISKGFGPLLDRTDLERAQSITTEQLPGDTAHALLALPVRRSAAGVIVAMADPTDPAAIQTLESTFPSGVLPTVARISDLAEALERTYPRRDAAAATANRHSDALELTRPRRITQALPLVRPKEPVDEPAPAKSASRNYAASSSPAWESAYRRASSAPAEPKPESAVPAGLPSVLPFEPKKHLQAIERAVDRDAVIRATCEAAAQGARSACFIAMRKKVFRGWYGAGPGVTPDGVRSLWIPVDKPCALRDAIEAGEPTRVTFGETAPDQLVRSALGGEGQALSLAPVELGGKIIGLLCAADWGHELAALHGLSAAAAKALTRVIAERKSRP